MPQDTFILTGEEKMLEIRKQRESRKERIASSWEKCVKQRSPLPYNESHPPRMRGTYPVLPCSKEVDLEMGLGQVKGIIKETVAGEDRHSVPA